MLRIFGFWGSGNSDIPGDSWELEDSDIRRTVNIVASWDSMDSGDSGVSGDFRDKKKFFFQKF